MAAKKYLSLSLFICLFAGAFSQYRTPAQQQLYTGEDSLQNGLTKSKTILSGYGNAYYQRNLVRKHSIASLERVVLFVGHKFNAKISFFSELEIENAVVAGSEAKGEIAMEQAFLKFNLTPKQYVVAGLFIPRIGMLNENHLPVNFNGSERPMVEQLVIPATWRELGVGYYGSLNRMPLNYSIALVNGLNSAGMEHGDGIRAGRGEGSRSFANNLALTGSLQYSFMNFRFQTSGYVGGTVGLNPSAADSLSLNSGMFGTPVYLGEANVQYYNNGFSGKLLFAYISYPEAAKVNVAYGKNLANGMYGTYAELGYDVLYHRNKQAQLITFVRYENLDLNAKLPAPPTAIYDGTLKQSHVITGISYLPIPNVVVKADMRFKQTGPQNTELIINPAPNAIPYSQKQQFLNLSVGYSF